MSGFVRDRIALKLCRIINNLKLPKKNNYHINLKEFVLLYLLMDSFECCGSFAFILELLKHQNKFGNKIDQKIIHLKLNHF